MPVGNNFIIGTDTAVNNQNFGNNNPLLKDRVISIMVTVITYTIDNVVEPKAHLMETIGIITSIIGMLTCFLRIAPVAYGMVVSCASSIDEKLVGVQIYPNRQAILLLLMELQKDFSL